MNNKEERPMPHYKDGTVAKVGDQVFGKLYNTPGVRAGTIISITPGVESCNAMVGFLMTVPLVTTGGEDQTSTPPRMSVAASDGLPKPPRRTRTEQHGSAGPEVHVYECIDYCAANELTKVDPSP